MSWHPPIRLFRWLGPSLSTVLPEDPFLDLDLNAEERGLEDDVVRADLPDAEDLFRDVLADPRREEVAGGLVLERLARVAVDVGHRQVDVLLREVVERRASVQGVAQALSGTSE